MNQARVAMPDRSWRPCSYKRQDTCLAGSYRQLLPVRTEARRCAPRLRCTTTICAMASRIRAVTALRARSVGSPRRHSPKGWLLNAISLN